MLLNAFSLNMLSEFPCSVTFNEITPVGARLILLTMAEAQGETEVIRSAVGHADTAAIFSEALGIPVPCNRATVALNPGDECVVGQYIGPRLPEGCKTLPEGASIKWLHVAVGAWE